MTSEFGDWKDAINEPPLAGLEPAEGWAVVQDGLDWARWAYWETLFSLSNGLIGMRGNFDEPMPRTPVRPLCFMAGLYNTLPEGLPQWPPLPDWLCTRVDAGGEAFDLRYGRTLHFRRWLDLQRGILVRDVVWENGRGQITRLTFLRFLSLSDPHLAGVRLRVMPLNWSGALQVEMALGGVFEPPGATSPHSHWSTIQRETQQDGTLLLHTRTTQSHRPLTIAAVCVARCNKLVPPPVSTRGNALLPIPKPRKSTGETPVPHGFWDRPLAAQVFSIDARAGEAYTFDRLVSFFVGIPDAEADKRALQHVSAAGARGFDALLDEHVAACRRRWDEMDVRIDGPAEEQLGIRFNLFQLATLGPPADLVASIGPKGLTATHYSGHIFWDTEIYMVPFFALTHPQAARTLLMYRYHMLDGAKRKAASRGYKGAYYPWESADTGDETCPKYCPEPLTGVMARFYCGDIQDHVAADVAYAIHGYLQATGDHAFLWEYGAEIVFETARFWASRAARNDRGGYDIPDAMGPDEYHVHADNDAYTNYLARFNLEYAAKLWADVSFPPDQRQRLVEKLRLGPDEAAQWCEIAAHLEMNRDAKTGLVSQSDGFLDRREANHELIADHGPEPVTTWLGEGHFIGSKILKQAEVVALLALLERMFDRASREVNFDYYEPRTCHDSSLSASAHAWAAARIGRPEQAYTYLRQSMLMELRDTAGNTSAGLHTANMGGMWLAIVFGVAGLDISGDVPRCEPCLPPGWNGLEFHIIHRGTRYAVTCTREGSSIQPRP